MIFNLPYNLYLKQCFECSHNAHTSSCADLAVRCTHVYLYTIMHTPSTLPTDTPGVQLQSYPIHTQWHNTGLDHCTGLGQQSPQTKYTSLDLWPWWYNTDNSQVHEPGQSAHTHLHLSYLSVCLCISSCMLSHVHYKASIQVSCLHAHCWSNKCYHVTQSTYYIIYYNYYISTIFDTVTLKDSQL